MAHEVDSDRWAIARAMALAFVTWAPPKEQIWLLSFNDTVQQRFGPSDEHKAIEDWLNDPSVREGKENKGRTAELQAISAANKVLSPPQPGDAIYIITDGGDNFSKVTAAQVVSYSTPARACLPIFSMTSTGRHKSRESGSTG